MKKIFLFFALTFFITFLAAANYFSKNVPKDLSSSLLLIELLPTDRAQILGEAPEQGNTFAANRLIKRNERVNALTMKHFKKYPYNYKLVQKNEVASNISSTGKTYFLKHQFEKIDHIISDKNRTRKFLVLEDFVAILIQDMSTNISTFLSPSSNNGLGDFAPKFIKTALKLEQAKTKD